VTTKQQETAAAVSIDDLRVVNNQINTEFTRTFAGVFAQHRTWCKATDYLDVLSTCDTPIKTCWELAEKAGHHTPGPFQSLIAENKWDDEEIWNRIATSISRLLPCHDDPLGPGLAVDETAQLKRGHHTVATAVQWAGCLGRKANCVTSVFFSYVTPEVATWIAHELFLPKKAWFTGTGATGQARRTSAGVPDETVFQTKPQIARRKFQKLRDLGVGFTWAAGDEVYGRYAALRQDHETNGEAYAYFVPKNFRIPTSTGRRIRADELAGRVQENVEVRSAAPGLNGPRWYAWAMIEASTTQHFLLIRRPLPSSGTPTTEDTTAPETTRTRGAKTDAPDGTSYVYCYVPADSPISPTLSNLVLMAGRRWPIEETIATGKGPLGFDHNQYRTWTSLSHHTALCGMAMLKTAVLRARLENTSASLSDITHPDSGTLPTENIPTENIPTHQTHAPPPDPGRSPDTGDDLMIPLDDSPIPVRPDQSCPPDIGHIRLTLHETLRLIGIANAGLSRTRMAFHLRWSRWRRRHQAIARWHHWRARLTTQAAPT
jgi:SRSO17 transposase